MLGGSHRKVKTGTAERQQAWVPLPCRDSAQHTIARWGRHAMGRHCPPVLAAFQRCRRQPEVAAVPGAGGRSQLCQNRAVSTSPSQEMHIVQPRCCVKGSGPALQTHPRAFFCVPVLFLLFSVLKARHFICQRLFFVPETSCTFCFLSPTRSHHMFLELTIITPLL